MMKPALLATASATLPLAQWLNAGRADNTLIAWQDQQRLTLAHLRYDVQALSQQLASKPGRRWALCFENSYLFIVALLGCLYAGKTPVIPGHCRAALLDEQRALFDGVLSGQPLCCQRPLIQLQPSGQCAATPPLAVISPQQQVELLTSGTTGQPRRVSKPIDCLDAEVRLLAAHFADRLANCRIIASVVPMHQYGLTFRIMLPMALGLPLHAMMLYYAEQLTALDASYRYVFISSPAFLKRLDYQLNPPPVSLILSAGGELRWQDVQKVSDWLHCPLHEIYGSTETGVLAWRHRDQPACPWRLFAGVRLQPVMTTPDVRDHQHSHHQHSHDEHCHAAIMDNKSDNNRDNNKYDNNRDHNINDNRAHNINNNQETANGWRALSPMIPQPEGVLLDDELQFDSQGGFQLCGRRGRVVKIEEKRVSLCEVERRLLALDGVCDAAALLIHSEQRQSIAALIVLTHQAYQHWLNSDGKRCELAWRRALLPWLEPVAVPRFWRVVPAIPLNSMGKRVNQQLQELFYATSRAATHSAT